MMEGVIKRGTAKKLQNLDVPIAGKTGTTNQNLIKSMVKVTH